MRADLVVAALARAGCTNQALEERRAYLQQFLGQPEETVLREMGVPMRTIESNGTRFLAYVEKRSDIYHPSPPMALNRIGRPGYGPAMLPGEVVERNCETTFEISDGRVKAWRMHGDGCVAG